MVERSDGRYRFFHYRGEQCLSALVNVGRGVVALRSPSPERKLEYLDVLSEINDQYLEARSFEHDVRGKFYRYDEEAEKRFRLTVTEELSRSIEQLHRLLSAHDGLLESVPDTGKQASDGTLHREKRAAVSRYTSHAVRDGWYPIIESYDHSLDPGERIAEGKRRRRQRLHGQQTLPGIVHLLDTPLFERITGEDITRLRELDRFAPMEERRVASRLTNRHPWLLTD
ncbi:hypothetical protein [Haladaptatus caseinilyticus]|uniref:hypothetical protein n=1 Tax=Haladaptatus caseinilyticus TaxID=2993314 RepID=UPI00224ACC92|nr:hypothetical protein [Haladaptatus caseinilyticus]